MRNKLKKIFIVLGIIGLLSSCVDDTFEAPLTAECVEPNLVKNKEVQEIYNISGNTPLLYGYSATDPNLGANDVIEAYVTSSDEGGNFFKTMTFIATDGSRGFSMSIDDYNLYTKHLQPGTKVYVKLKGLYHSLPSGYARGLTFGSAPTTIPDRVERIPTLEYAKYLIPTCGPPVSEDSFVKHITLAQANNDALINSLVEIDNVQFEIDGGTYDSNTTDNYDSSIYITNGTNSLAVRTSRYANFAGYVTPSGSGKIRGVITKYNNGFQLVLRTERDTKDMTGPRVDYSLPIVGGMLQYTGTLAEPFTSYTVNNSSFPRYINDPAVGGRVWQVKQFGTPANKYIQMSSFGGTAEVNKAAFIVPVDFTAANTFSFKTLSGYDNGSPLKIYYSTDYVPGGILANATLVDITSNFTIPNGPSSAYASSFTSSGAWTIPTTLTGNGYFIFVYNGNGNGGVTTTMEVDDITIN